MRYHNYATTLTPDIHIFTYHIAKHFLFKIDRPIGNLLNLTGMKDV